MIGMSKRACAHSVHLRTSNQRQTKRFKIFGIFTAKMDTSRAKWKMPADWLFILSVKEVIKCFWNGGSFYLQGLLIALFVLNAACTMSFSHFHLQSFLSFFLNYTFKHYPKHCYIACRCYIDVMFARVFQSFLLFSFSLFLPCRRVLCLLEFFSLCVGSDSKYFCQLERKSIFFCSDTLLLRFTLNYLHIVLSYHWH